MEKQRELKSPRLFVGCSTLVARGIARIFVHIDRRSSAISSLSPMGFFLIVAAATALLGPANIRLGIGARRIRGVLMTAELSEIEQL